MNDEFRDALYLRDFETFRRLVNSIDSSDKHDVYTKLLHEATWARWLDAMRLLIELGTDVNVEGGYNGIPLRIAASNGFYEGAMLLIPKTSADNINEVLLVAAKYGKDAITQALINAGADVHVRTEYGSSTLQTACESNGNVETLQVLINAGADVNDRNLTDGETPLFQAARTGFEGSVRTLLRAGARYNIKRINGDTLLHETNNNKTLVNNVRDLIAAGADVNALGASGRTPLHSVARAGNIEVAELFIRHGADVNAKDESGNTPLHEAAGRFHGNDMISLLIEHGADLNVVGKNRQTPLHVAAMRAEEGNVKELLRAGADVNVKDECDNTPLHVVAIGREYRNIPERLAIAKLLMKHGANPYASNCVDKTPAKLVNPRDGALHSYFARIHNTRVFGRSLQRSGGPVLPDDLVRMALDTLGINE